MISQRGVAKSDKRSRLFDKKAAFNSIHYVHVDGSNRRIYRVHVLLYVALGFLEFAQPK
jgi:hypothetical protein